MALCKNDMQNMMQERPLPLLELMTKEEKYAADEAETQANYE